MMMAVTTGGNGVIMEKMTMVTIKIPMIPTTMTGINMTMKTINIPMIHTTMACIK